MTISVTGVPETQVIDGRGFAIRHVRPGAGEGASTVTVLGRAYGFEWLPLSTLPTSPDLVEGSYTRRLGDAGEFTLRFPNVASSKGLWREKFSEAGSLEFVEIYRDDVLEFVGSIERVEVDRGTVTISGGDGWSLLKRAYERDRTWWDAPATVIDAYTRVPVPVLREQWSDLSAWTETTGVASVSGGNLVLDTSNELSADVTASGTDWIVEAQIPVQPSTTLGAIIVSVTDGDVTPTTIGTLAVSLNKNGVTGDGVGNGSAYYAKNMFPLDDAVTTPTAIRLIRNGRVVSGYVGGHLVGVIEAGDNAPAGGIIITSTGDSILGELVFTDMAPFLHRGTADGDAVLPGDLPTGGLRGRYHNIGNLQGFAAARRQEHTLTPESEPYDERLDEVVNSSSITLPLTPGAATSYYAIRWTGAVYLPLSGGQVDFRLTGLDDGARVWVGDTAWGAALIDDWNDGAPRTTSTGTTALGTSDGWYPIRVEYFNGASTGSITLQYRRATGWTDPGGTTIANNTWTTVPATSLSPLGCHEARIQGQSHFQIVQDAAAQAGYELILEPMSLESGEFPGRLVPRLRVGRDTDVVLQVEDDPSAEPILTPAVTRDASDQAVRVIGTGSGSADGRGSQTIAEVADLTADALFELQSWTDAGDATLPQLLEARLNAELALRATPWEEVRGVPRAFERLADTWPLTGVLSAMRWRPGDGLRISVPDIGVVDADPRQLTQVTRSFAAEGRTSTQVAWRQRPRSATEAIRRLARSQALAVRSNQGRRITLTSPYVEQSVAAGGYTNYAVIPLFPGDQVLRAECRYVIDNGGTGALTLDVNTVDRTAALGGPWSTYPVTIDFTAYATQWTSTDNRVFARMGRPAATTTGFIIFQLVIEVLRP